MSNRAGTDGHLDEAAILEETTAVKVLRHSIKKPGCTGDIWDYLRNIPDLGLTQPSQIVVVGDRLLTDIVMANMMGAMGVWIQEGVEQQHGIVRRRKP